MRRSLALVARDSLASVLSVATLIALGSGASAQILQTHAESLTTYLVGPSNVQDVCPLPTQRGVALDGSMRKGGSLPFSISGNPFENAWRGEASIDGVDLDTGAWSPTEVDIALPAPGFRWVIGRSYNARQDNSGHHDSGGHQGVALNAIVSELA